MEDNFFEFTVSFFDINGDRTEVQVAKLGGGTVGKKYEGSWEVQVDGPYGLSDVMGFRSGTLHSHFDVAMETHGWYLMDNGEA